MPKKSAKTTNSEAVKKSAELLESFIRRYEVTPYRLAKDLGTTQGSVFRWLKHGHPNPVIFGLAMKTLERNYCLKRLSGLVQADKLVKEEG